ncbi:MAG: hypothetical protein ACXV3S_11360, partial [Kineosporiaceae bacterium]
MTESDAQQIGAQVRIQAEPEAAAQPPVPEAGGEVGTSGERRALHAVVLAGGLNFEREVSLSSGTQVVEGLVRAGIEAELRDADADLLPGLA